MASGTRSDGPGGATTDVWWATLRALEALDRSALSPEETARVARLQSAAGQERSALARVLLRAVLADRLTLAPAAVALDWSAGPRLTGGPDDLWLSLSHSADRVVVAVSSAGPVGVDIEPAARAERLRPGTVERACSVAERTALAALPDDRRATVALALWTTKEAILKTSGHGLTVAPEGVEVDDIVAPALLTRFDPEPDLAGRCHLRPLTHDAAYVGTVAVASNTPPAITEHDGDALLRSGHGGR